MILKLSDNLLRALTAIVALAAGASSLFIGSSALTFILGLILIFFLPGYALSRLIFGRDLKLDLFILTSIGLSLLASILIALALAISPLRLTQESALASLLGLTLVALILDRIRHPESMKIEVEFVMPRRDEIDPVIATVLAFAIIVAAAFAFYIITAEHPSRTHILIMSVNGDDNLPSNGTVGEPIEFQLELMNGEGEVVDFAVELSVNASQVEFLVDDSSTTAFTTTLENMETEVFDISVIPEVSGYQQVRIDVYINGDYYNELHFWVNILE